MKLDLKRITRALNGRRGKKPGSPATPRVRPKMTEFGDVQRRINIYLRALWGNEFVMQLIPPDPEQRRTFRPYVRKGIIHLPHAYRDAETDTHVPVAGLDIYRAAAIHAAAHIMYSQGYFPDAGLSKWEQAVISTIEDARVESLALRQFPGLKPLWIRQHIATPQHDKTAGDYLNRLARALLDETYADDDPWIVRGRALFDAADLETEHIALTIGTHLARTFHKKLKFKVRTDIPSALYRDDNRCLWEPAKRQADDDDERPDAFFKFKFSLLETNRIVSTGEDIRQTTEEFKAPEGGEPISAPYLYGEWDYRSQSVTPAWVTLREMFSRTGDLQTIDDIILRNSHLISRMKTLLDSIRYGGVRRIRKLEVGDEIDVNAAIRAQIDLRMREQPDERVMMRTARKNRDISVLVLLDLSNSMNEKVRGQEHTVIELTREVCVLFADALEKIGDPFAIHGFCSKTRHYVEYYRLKDFDQPYDDVSKARIAGMSGQLATRMGAAIRHATHHLNQQKSGRKLLMIVTDGAPDDIDLLGNKKYLPYDTKMSVEEANRDGINTYCISLDPKADEYVSRIFGAKNYIVFDHVRFMPEKLFLLYAGLTR